MSTRLANHTPGNRLTYSRKSTKARDRAGVPAMRIGTSGGKDLTLPDGGTISVDELRVLHERFFPSWMAEGMEAQG